MVRIIGAGARISAATNDLVEGMREQIQTLTGGLLDDEEVDKATAGAVLDTVEAYFRARHPGGSAEALAGGVLMIVARELRLHDGLEYEQAVALLLEGFAAQWDACGDEALEAVPAPDAGNGTRVVDRSGEVHKPDCPVSTVICGNVECDCGEWERLAAQTKAN